MTKQNFLNISGPLTNQITSLIVDIMANMFVGALPLMCSYILFFYSLNVESQCKDKCDAANIIINQVNMFAQSGNSLINLGAACALASTDSGEVPCMVPPENR